MMSSKCSVSVSCFFVFVNKVICNISDSGSGSQSGEIKSEGSAPGSGGGLCGAQTFAGLPRGFLGSTFQVSGKE